MRKKFFSDLSCTHGRTCVYGRYAPGIKVADFCQKVLNHCFLLAGVYCNCLYSQTSQTCIKRTSISGHQLKSWKQLPLIIVKTDLYLAVTSIKQPWSPVFEVPMSNLLLSSPLLNCPFDKMCHTSAKGYTVQGVQWSFTDLPTPKRHKKNVRFWTWSWEKQREMGKKA